MNDISIRITGRAGRVTLNRPQALNALTYEMCLAIEDALDRWSNDTSVDLIVLDAAGDRAFCSGGDIAELYATGKAGNYGYGRKFWADEYRLNAKIFSYSKPVISFMQGFTMGGGVGLGCHGSHRIVGETSQIAMPECGIGLIPDVGGSLMLALAPGRVGEYLGITATRMSAQDAIFAGFADNYIPQDRWPDLISDLEGSGDVAMLTPAILEPPVSNLQRQQAQIDVLFDGEMLGDILNNLRADGGEFALETLTKMGRMSPLAMASAIEVIHRLRGPSLTIEKALDLEYRFTYRAMEHGDFLEGIRAAIIDKDRKPAWQFADMNVPLAATGKMLRPLGNAALTLEITI
tara:strand:- start:3136 stop:4179 length:1044 start_codon:yes stop_codon:yes gene_type:complete